MGQITASLVKELRERTGVGMMECKKALVAANGDIDKAIEDLRKAGQAKAVKKGARIAAEGLVIISTSADNKRAAILEINCETDFVAREDRFKQFAKDIVEVAIQAEIKDIEALKNHLLESGKKVEDARLELVAQLGENIAVRRVTYLQAKDGVIGSYLHGSQDMSRIGALVEISKDKVALARDLAMQVAAMKPEYLNEAEVDPVRLAKEKEILLAQAKEENAGKPEDILGKIISGKLKKFVRGITLLGQASIKDSSNTVEQILKAEGVEALTMSRFEVGEGIEKKADNFAEEVKALSQGN